MRSHPWLVSIFSLCSLAGCVALQAQEKLTAEQQRFFEAKIRPVLVTHCYECHSVEAGDVGGKLLLDSRAGIRAGGESGPAIVPGKPSSSLLLLAMQHSDPKLIMPPADSGAKLPAHVIADFESWIRMGGPDPRAGGKSKQDDGATEAKQWWAWQPIQVPQVPWVSSDWVRNDIDRFVWTSLQDAQLQPSKDADRVTIIRRLAFDLTGLPPTEAELEQYALSSTPPPIEQLVDKYLDSEQYGERMGRRWLDVARYAESTGKDVNVAYPHAWRFRDYVIDAFNADMPYDEFVAEQIAGDLLKSQTPEEAARRTIATGFLAIGAKGLGEQNPRQFAVDVADEQIDALSQTFLAVTIACARCHDHKFDPISQRDYTAMAGVLLSTATHFGTTGGVAGRNRSTLVELPASYSDSRASRQFTSQQVEQMRERLAELDRQRRDYLAEVAAQRRSGRTDARPQNFVQVQQQVTQLETQLSTLNPDGSIKALALAVSDKPAAPDFGKVQQRFPRFAPQFGGRRDRVELMFIADSPQFIRGEIDKPGDVVPRGLPEFLAGEAKAEIGSDESGRLQLAHWIASDRNPLTARVMFNRVWSWLMGQGLVKSVDNFGTTGNLPSHPQLLDHLAHNFIQSNWSVKKLVREIVLSHTYLQSSEHNEAAFLIDPDNRFLWRANRRSLEAECLRDGMLAASGTLRLDRPHGSLISRSGDGPIGGRRLGGASEELITATHDAHRSVYLPIPRNVLPDSLELFDFADNSIVTGARSTTIVPSQSLYWLNNSAVEKECRLLADLVLGQSQSSSNPSGLLAGRLAEPVMMPEGSIEQVFERLSLLVLSRPPLAEEKKAGVEYVLQKQQGGSSQQTIWAGVARSLFGSADYRFLK
jgi:hypothetical protein